MTILAPSRKTTPSSTQTAPRAGGGGASRPVEHHDRGEVLMVDSLTAARFLMFPVARR